jgi:uncharacterized membrane protein (GlpM family)
MFTVQLVTSFLAGGIFIALQTLFGERVPLKWRGAVLTIPSTMALGFIFIALTKTPQDTREASIVIPAAIAVDYIFVLIFAYLSKFNQAISFIGGFASWAVSAFALIKFPPENFTLSLAYCIPPILIMYFLIRKLPQETKIEPVPMTIQHTLIRSFIGGSIITTIVILSNTFGNVWGGLFTVFPAAYTATFLIYYRTHGKKIIPSIAKSFFFPGIPGFIIYAYIAGITFPIIGIWLGTLAAYAGTAAFYLIYNFAKNLNQDPD